MVKSAVGSTPLAYSSPEAVQTTGTIAPHGHAVDRATVRQRKTGQLVRFEMTEQTREAIDNYIRAANKKPDEFLFGGRRGRDLPITTQQYARLVDQCGLLQLGWTRASLGHIHSAEPRRR